MRQFMKPERIRIIAVLAIFNYIFLGSEYLFDNMIRYATDSAGVVRAQNYVLGISVIGFLLFPVSYTHLILLKYIRNWNVQSNLESAHGRLIKSEKRPSAALAANRIS